MPTTLATLTMSHKHSSPMQHTLQHIHWQQVHGQQLAEGGRLFSFATFKAIQAILPLKLSRVHAQSGWKVRTPRGCWAALLNVLNFADFALHAWYAWLLAALLLNSPGPLPAPAGLHLAGLP